MLQLTNGIFQAEISEKGAELKSFRRLADGREYIWGGDPRFWAKSSPVLFPIVGALINDTYLYEDRAYQLPRHGFARDQIFAEHKVSDTEAYFTLHDTSASWQVYPFAFRLTVRYVLEGESLHCIYEVANPDDERTLLFSLGGHPAFAIDTGNGVTYNDSYLEFPDDITLDCHQLEGNLISDSVRRILLRNHRLYLEYALFYNDALILKTLKSRQITLRNQVTGQGLRFRFDDFPYFGIWAAKDADFVCLEPWCGIADVVGHNQQFTQKIGIVRLEPRGRWTRGWTVTCF